ncbi:TPA: hypothetical protein DIV48_01940 [Candidatus Kaiserbacteria bacterium]|nr:MAG: hypothetical protein UY93_C0005G0010 [Parcubacteria group bacterium GW2011_GWA1_56_13]KKW45881.1 MAG: hypothetical protein UY97_C0013G0010 [Parcubacteria group bacterium GW2011_GWB1_57_6]HCR52393.1 hypothetical protein [Candidatus Kaiserbacteria bacterium]
MKIIFIAGPLTTGGDGSSAYIEKNIRIAEEYAFALAKVGVGFFCAHTHTSNHHGHAPEPFYYELDFEILKRAADALLAIPGWEKSLGARKEVEWARENGLKAFYPKDSTDIEDIVRWAKK